MKTFIPYSWDCLGATNRSNASAFVPDTDSTVGDRDETEKKIVSYYFNVFMLRKRAEQNRK